MGLKFITTRVNTDLTIDQLVRNRYARVIGALQEKGFSYFLSYSEQQFPLSLVLITPIYLMMRSQAEILRVTGLLQVTAFYPLLIHRETGTIALVNGLNTKFYTRFTDGTLIISVSSETKIIQDPAGKLFKASFQGSVTTVWEKHLEWMGVHQMDGLINQLTVGFEEYCAMSEREDRSSKTDALGMILVWVFVLWMLGRGLDALWTWIQAQPFWK